MNDTILFKWEAPNETMATRYLLYELKISKKLK